MNICSEHGYGKLGSSHSSFITGGDLFGAIDKGGLVYLGVKCSQFGRLADMAKDRGWLGCGLEWEKVCDHVAILHKEGAKLSSLERCLLDGVRLGEVVVRAFKVLRHSAGCVLALVELLGRGDLSCLSQKAGQTLYITISRKAGAPCPSPDDVIKSFRLRRAEVTAEDVNETFRGRVGVCLDKKEDGGRDFFEQLEGVRGVLNSYFRGDDHLSTAKVLLVGTGADEQLGGYGRHRTVFKKRGLAGLKSELSMELGRLWKRNLGRDDRCISDNGKESRLPFLDEDLVSFLSRAREEHLNQICDLTLPEGVGDKLILRNLANDLGLADASTTPKRAMQFGTRVAQCNNYKMYGSNTRGNKKGAGQALWEVE